jgi:hypothetical protein
MNEQTIDDVRIKDVGKLEEISIIFTGLSPQ